MTGLKDFQRQRQGLGLTSQRSRDRLVERLRDEGVADLRVLAALAQVPRHLFVDEALASRAYEDTALPIGLGQTISQPFVVARMTELLMSGPPLKRVLEVGTGSGYQAAVLAALVEEVYTVERIDDLLRQARRRFRRLGLEKVRTRHADGGVGWLEQAPFDAIVVTAGARALSADLFEQLGSGGMLVAPVGAPNEQRLVRWTRTDNGLLREDFERVTFVPLLPGIE